jgi:hypothetical protein
VPERLSEGCTHFRRREEREDLFRRLAVFVTGSFSAEIAFNRSSMVIEAML